LFEEEISKAAEALGLDVPIPTAPAPVTFKLLPAVTIVVFSESVPPNLILLEAIEIPFEALEAPGYELFMVKLPVVEVGFTFNTHTTDVLMGRVSASPPVSVCCWSPLEVDVVAAMSIECV
jgi:hypothetical protein